MPTDGSDFKGERLTVQFARGPRRKEEFPGGPFGRPAAPRPRRTMFRMQISGLPETSWQVSSPPPRVGYPGPHSPATSLPGPTETWTLTSETKDLLWSRSWRYCCCFLSPLEATVSCPNILSGAKWIKNQEDLLFAGLSGHNPWPGRRPPTACPTVLWTYRIHLFLDLDLPLAL